MPVEFFFEGAPSASERPRAAAGFREAADTYQSSEFLATNEGVQLNKAFVRITDAKVRRRVVDLVRSLAQKRPIATATDFEQRELEQPGDLA